MTSQHVTQQMLQNTRSNDGLKLGVEFFFIFDDFLTTDGDWLAAKAMLQLIVKT